MKAVQIKAKPEDLKITKNTNQTDEYNIQTIWYALEGNGLMDIWVGKFPDSINQTSRVFASIAELDRNNRTAFQGSATMKVYNVVNSFDGTISVRVEVDWNSPLLFQLVIYAITG